MVGPAESFDDLPLDPRLLRAVATLGFEVPTPIQAEAIPLLLEGRDVVGGARTGSGKTAAFGLPLLERVKDGGPVRALVLTPTRELAIQNRDALEALAADLRVKVVAIYGGASYTPQLRAIREGVTVIVGTPGRVLDLMDNGNLDLSTIEMLVLDEGDEMLRMGFIDDVERIVAATPPTRQVALFSATMPDAIRRIADRHLRDPVAVHVETETHTTEHIQQKWMRVPNNYKIDALIRVLKSEHRGTTLVFARTRASCIEVSDELAQRGVAVDALHGEMNQGARERVLQRMRSSRLDLVVATDVAARGLDVEHVTHVINLDMPQDTDTYVHRIGRTGRAGRDGTAITFVTPKQVRIIKQLAYEIGADIEYVPVPTEADIAEGHRKRLATALGAAIDGDDGDARAFVERLRREHGSAVEEIAVAAVRLLAQARDIALGEPAPAAEPEWAAERPNTRPDRDLHRANEVELFFPVGGFKRVGPGDLMGALANEAGIPGHEIGKITILDRKSFVGVPREHAERVVRDFPRLVLRGMEVPVSLARPREPQSDGPRPHRGRPERYDENDRPGPPRGAKKGRYVKYKRNGGRESR